MVERERWRFHTHLHGCTGLDDLRQQPARVIDDQKLLVGAWRIYPLGIAKMSSPSAVYLRGIGWSFSKAGERVHWGLLMKRGLGSEAAVNEKS
jgi:hypothetical protein